MYNVIIVGSGPAGWTAAIYAARADMKPLLFEGPEPGGQLLTTTEVENFPGFPKGILGPELMEACKQQAKRFGTEVIGAIVDKVVPNADGTFTVTAAGKEYQSKTVILSMGASARRLGLDSERALFGKGVSACATCDGFFFKDKKVVVVGGGDSAMEEANFLTRFATSVTIVYRGDALRASKIMQERAKANPKISFIMNTEVTEVLGVETGKVTGVKLKNSKDGSIVDMAIDGMFTAIGHVPNSGIAKDLIEVDETGYVKTVPGSSKTLKKGTAEAFPGLFACGDLQDHYYRQAVTAAGSGCMAALDAERFLSHG
jgi:thioredoxin reductase (NADPH)